MFRSIKGCGGKLGGGGSFEGVQPQQYVERARKCAPLLENFRAQDLPPSSSEWRAVPDIWKTTAELYGDRIALLDPHHNPPTQVTYKQVPKLVVANF